MTDFIGSKSMRSMTLYSDCGSMMQMFHSGSMMAIFDTLRNMFILYFFRVLLGITHNPQILKERQCCIGKIRNIKNV